ncbi:hypothetical protein SEA_KENREY_82 [Streptomyces phage Kenrey]|nr:hypothetical protein SEA_KENREY_82 [Streptomyces phage Kenrey]
MADEYQNFGVGQTYSTWPEDEMYRGVKIPKRIKANWNNVSGRWWKQGVDDALGSIDDFEQETFGR